MEKIVAALLTACFILTFSACGAPAESTGLVTGTPPASTVADAPSSEPVEQSLPGEYVETASVTVGDGRKLTLRLQGKELDGGFFGIREIDVLEGEKLLQTLLTEEAIGASWGADNDFGGYTQATTRDGGLVTEDVNFDGAEDIGLMGWSTTGANLPYYYWLWDGEKFVYAFNLPKVEVDHENQQLLSHTRESAAEYITNYYKYDENGKLLNVKRVVEKYDENGKAVTETYERKNGELQRVE